MPIVSQFHGISIYFYTESTAPHHRPHFHAYYNEYSATFTISPPDLLEGTLPRRQLRLVLAWAEMNQTELEANWQRVQTGQSPIRIVGL